MKHFLMRPDGTVVVSQISSGYEAVKKAEELCGKLDGEPRLLVCAITNTVVAEMRIRTEVDNYPTDSAVMDCLTATAVPPAPPAPEAE